MPIINQWWTLNHDLVKYDREDSGAYEFGDSNGNIVYIGSSDNIQRRLTEHLVEPAGSCTKRYAARYRIEYTSDFARREQQLLEEFVARNGKAPRCNEEASGANTR